MDYSTKTREELIGLCKEKGVKGYSGKRRDDIVALLQAHTATTMQVQTQDTGKFRTNTKDQFYTSEAVARSCIQRILSAVTTARDYLWVEPSAGNGAFLHNIPAGIEKIGLDIEPKADDIRAQDYLKWDAPTGKPILVVGNPPFGRQSSLAKAFIAKSCKFANVIAFILPKSFTKPSMFNAFDLQFHLVQSVELQKDSFVINGEPYDVPCVFQIWQKRETIRDVEEKVDPVGFEYVKGDTAYDVAVRRVGALAGKCYKKGDGSYSIQSHYFLKFDAEAVTRIDEVVGKINAHTFPSNTVGPRSLSKSEVNVVINAIIEELLAGAE